MYININKCSIVAVLGASTAPVLSSPSSVVTTGAVLRQERWLSTEISHWVPNSVYTQPKK